MKATPPVGSILSLLRVVVVLALGGMMLLGAPSSAVGAPELQAGIAPAATDGAWIDFARSFSQPPVLVTSAYQADEPCASYTFGATTNGFHIGLITSTAEPARDVWVHWIAVVGDPAQGVQAGNTAARHGDVIRFPYRFTHTPTVIASAQCDRRPLVASALHNRPDQFRVSLRDLHGRDPGLGMVQWIAVDLPAVDAIPGLEIVHGRQRQSSGRMVTFAPRLFDLPTVVCSARAHFLPRLAAATESDTTGFRLATGKSEVMPLAQLKTQWMAVARTYPEGFGRIDITTMPKRAGIFVDGVYRGTTPRSVPVAPGDHVLTLTNSLCRPYEALVAIALDESRQIAAQLELLPCFINVRSSPRGARIKVNSHLEGYTNKTFAMAPGTYHLQLIRPGYRIYYKRVTLVPGQTVRVRAHLVSKAPERKAEGGGCIRVTSTPSGAKVSIDGHYKGLTPLVITGVKPGRHLVRVYNLPQYPYDNQVTVRVGETVRVHVKF